MSSARSQMSDINIFENTILDSDLSINTINEILIIQKKCSLSEWTCKDYKNEFERIDSRQIIATKTKTIVGFGILRLISPFNKTFFSKLSFKFEEAEILNIAVDPILQNKGIGNSMLEKMVAVSSSSGVKRIWLDVRESNNKAINFYKKNKFHYAYSRQNYYQSPSENAWIMKRELD